MQPTVGWSPEPAFEPLQVINTKLIQNSAVYFLLTSFVHRNQFLRDATLLDRSSRWLALLTRRFDSTDLLIPSQALWIGDSRHEERRVHMAFHLLACDANQQVVDVVESLEAGGEPLSYFFGGDGHLNAKGHSLVANRFTAAVLLETHDCGS